MTFKQAFPGTKFSVKSSTYSMGSSVNVRWSDGPLGWDVDDILSRFKSGFFDGMKDMYSATGYEWEGKIIIGAKYVSSSRELSMERRDRILEKLREQSVPDTHGDYKVKEWIAAEKQLIADGELQGYPSQLINHAAVIEQEEVALAAPSVDMGQLGKVIPFPVQSVRDPKLAEALRADRQKEMLTPEQQLKLQLLQTLLGKDEVAKLLLLGEVTVDKMFKSIAERVYG